MFKCFLPFFHNYVCLNQNLDDPLENVTPIQVVNDGRPTFEKICEGLSMARYIRK
jgi:hypothetical protein